MNAGNDIAIYFHWPFCLKKCPYCDFNVHVDPQVNHDAWKNAYLKAIDHYAALTNGRRVVSVFFGGGTPSLMAPETVKAVLDAIKDRWSAAPDMEVTLEANPTSVEIKKFEQFRDAGINRVSLGVQALNDKDLKFLGRQHGVANALAALETAKNIFGRFSFDLIYARPGQSLKNWEEELTGAVKLAKGHMSLYQLTIERSTPFYLEQAQGKFTMPDDGMAADFYHLTQGIMEKAGLPSYEVSNHAQAGHESRHNLVYWNYGDYIGIGPGAHGRLSLNGKKYATRDHAAPDIWLPRVQTEGYGYHPFEEIKPRERFLEALMMGLRLPGGVKIEKLETEGQCDFFTVIDEEKLRTVIDEGWAVYDERALRLTREGLLRLNAVIPFILK